MYSPVLPRPVQVHTSRGRIATGNSWRQTPYVERKRSLRCQARRGQSDLPDEDVAEDGAVGDHAGASGSPKTRAVRNWEWLLEAPRVRLRTTRDRLLAQLGELAVLNERLAGNEARDARARIEFLQTRRRNWEQIFDYVTKQDVAATLAVIEEANKKVEEALSEDTSERSGVSALKRHLLDLQGEVAEAKERLTVSQARLEHNLQRIQDLQREAASLERRAALSSTDTSTSALPATEAARQLDNSASEAVPGQELWYPVAFAARLEPDSMIPFDLFNVPWVLFRDADGRAACIKDECAHRACPLSLGKVVAGRAQCPYHGWEYERDGSCVHMPSTTQISGVGVPSLPCIERDGLLWVATSPPAWPSTLLPAAPPPSFARLPPGHVIVAEVEVEEEGLDAGAMLEIVLGGSHVLATEASHTAPDLPARMASRLGTHLCGATTPPLATFQPPSAVHTLLDIRGFGPQAVSLHQLHVCLPAKKRRARVLLRLSLPDNNWAAHLPHSFWEHTAKKAMARDVLLAKAAGGHAMLGPWH